MTRDNWPSWPDRVVARFPVWRKEALLLFPLSCIAVLTPNATKVTNWVELLQWCLVALIGATSGWAYNALFAHVFIRGYNQWDSQVIKGLWVIGAGAGTGVAFALGVTVSAKALNLPDTEPLWWRVLGSGIIICWFGIALLLALDTRARLRSERDRLVQQAIAIESGRLNATAIVDDMRLEVSQEVEQALRAARKEIDMQVGIAPSLPNIAQWQVVAATLRSTASDTVRPLSRELWDLAPQVVQRPKAWSLLIYVIGNQPLRPFAVSVLYVLGGISFLLQRVNPLSAVVELSAGVAIIVAVMTIANLLMSRFPSYHALFFVTAAMLLQMNVVVNAWFSSTRNLDASVTSVISSVLAGLVVIISTSTFGAVRNLTQLQLDAIAARIDLDFIESTAHSQALAGVLREASVVMHGSVQSRLLGCAIAVEESGKSRNAEQFNLALARARAELENPLIHLGRAPATSIRSELERRRELWEGLCAVSYEVSSDIPDLPASTVAACGRIIEEGISNAARHGAAQNVVIGIDWSPVAFTKSSPSLLRITVTDDGTGIPDGSLSSGLGLRMIRSEATSWSLMNLNGRSQLTVELPVIPDVGVLDDATL